MTNKFTVAERIGGMIITPKVILTYVKDNPNWLFPFILMLIGGVITGLSMVIQMIDASPSVFIIIGAFFSLIGMIFFVWIVWLIKTSVIYCLVKISGGKDGNFYPLLSTIGYSYVPFLIQNLIIAILTLFLSPGYHVYQFFSLAQFFNIDTDTISHIVVSNIEIFTIWNLILCGLCINIIYKFSWKKSAIIILIYWILVVLVQIFFLGIAKLIQELPLYD